MRIPHLDIKLHYAAVRQLVELDPRHFDLDVNAVQQRSRDALLVLGHGGGSAGARLHQVAVVAAGAGVHRRHKRVLFTIGTECFRSK
jgi:hypothetical protein